MEVDRSGCVSRPLLDFGILRVETSDYAIVESSG
jgi:hypothetical protein